MDLVIVMLGTNDLHYTDAAGYREGLSVVADRILKANTCFPGTSLVFREEPKLLLISPIEVTPESPFYQESLKFPEMTAQVAQKLGVPWMNAALFAKPSPLDRCHMEESEHLSLGQAVYEKVKESL